jgi:hypothetical protein
MAHSLTDRYEGTVPVICYPEGITRFLYPNGIRIFDLPAVRPDAARSCAGLQTVKWINFFEAGDSALLHALQNPRVNIAGIRRADILPTCKCSRQPGCRGKKVARARR